MEIRITRNDKKSDVTFAQVAMMCGLIRIQSQ